MAHRRGAKKNPALINYCRILIVNYISGFLKSNKPSNNNIIGHVKQTTVRGWQQALTMISAMTRGCRSGRRMKASMRVSTTTMQICRMASGSAECSGFSPWNTPSDVAFIGFNASAAALSIVVLRARRPPRSLPPSLPPFLSFPSPPVVQPMTKGEGAMDRRPKRGGRLVVLSMHVPICCKLA